MGERLPLFAADEDWEADWASHARWQVTSGRAATPAQRLAWLEHIRAVAYRRGALPRSDEET